jgi:hypothetical protein
MLVVHTWAHKGPEGQGVEVACGHAVLYNVSESLHAGFACAGYLLYCVLSVK